ncbi:hypothetical protein SSCH_70011 [Syntrophaceticus schinkii]|jgi:hypothetical protein|uniref:Uncharacterized protein n=1 Tax=Syntrophaceticus schinkii TaxID=499207 RepID=A0A0B7MP38_9FIRM|nr:hypothetical protein SSCH_70011 [Syntrophaceticus schinkii]
MDDPPRRNAPGTVPSARATAALVPAPEESQEEQSPVAHFPGEGEKVLAVVFLKDSYPDVVYGS